MNFKRKLLCLLASLFFLMPFNIMAYEKYVIPSGETVGINIQTDGVYVVGFYKVDGSLIAYKQGVEIGDRIVSINDKKITDINSLSETVNTSNDNLNIKMGVMRNNKLKYIDLVLKRNSEGIYKTGMFVKDNISGIGTITFITLSGKYVALGHEVSLSDNNYEFSIANGQIYSSKVTSINKSKNNQTGEKNAKIFYDQKLGNIKNNFKTGIYGDYNSKINQNEAIEVGNMNEVKLGKAEIITVLDDNKKTSWEIEILSIDKDNDTKNFRIKITDKRLLTKTGGIIKGMSGSPIIQNGKIIGAVTHAIVSKPECGYGISIEKMLDNME